MLQGTVDRLETVGKFGFIIGPNGEEYYFHQSALLGSEYGELAAGTPVVFNVGEDEGDRTDEHLRAVDVRLADDAIPADDNEPIPTEKLGE